MDLSTRELEPEHGDMLKNPKMVYDAAENFKARGEAKKAYLSSLKVRTYV